MPVEHKVHRVTVDRLFEPARAEKGHDLRGLAFNCRADRRVMQQGDTPLRTQPRQRALELDGLVERFLNKQLGRRLAPRAERRAPESTGKTLRSRDSDT